MAIVRYTAEQLRKMPTQTDLKRVRAMKDEDIDYSDCPDVSELLRQGKVRFVGRPKKEICKESVSIRLCPSDLKALRKSGRGWQTRVSDLISYGIEQGIL